GQGVLGPGHDAPRRLRVGDAEEGAQRGREGHLVAQPAGRPLRDPNAWAPPRATQITNRDHADPAPADIVVGRVRRLVADLSGKVQGRKDGKEQPPSNLPTLIRSSHQSVSLRSRPVISGGGSSPSIRSTVGPTSRRAPPWRRGVVA